MIFEWLKPFKGTREIRVILYAKEPSVRYLGLDTRQRNKDYRNPHLIHVWYHAERVLRKADRVVFIGYSLPDDDVEVVYLFKRGLAHLEPRQITVVEYDRPLPPANSSDAVRRRYRTLFGDGIDWHSKGMDDWVVQQQPAGGAA